MSKFARLIFLFAAAAGLTMPLASAFAQLKVEEKETSLELLALEEKESAPLPAPETMAVYIPEPGTYGLMGAAGLGLLLALRRITLRSSALAS